VRRHRKFAGSETGGPQPLPLHRSTRSTRSAGETGATSRLAKFSRRGLSKINEPEPKRAWSESLPILPRHSKKDLDSFQELRSHIASGSGLLARRCRAVLQSIQVRRTALIRATANQRHPMLAEPSSIARIARQRRGIHRPQRGLPNSPASSPRKNHVNNGERWGSHAERWDLPWQGTDPGNTRGTAWQFRRSMISSRAVIGGTSIRRPEMRFWKIATLGTRFARAQARRPCEPLPRFPLKTFSRFGKLDRTRSIRARRHAADMALLTPEASESNLENALEEFESCVEDRSRRIRFAAGWQRHTVPTIECCRSSGRFVLNLSRTFGPQTTAVKNSPN